jgi:hypothetical protein
VTRGHGGQGKSLVIQTSDAEAKSLAKLEEDLAVMSLILEKALSQKMVEVEDPQTPYMGINVLFGPGSTPIRSLALEGYGALFLLNVNFPLLPPPEKPEAAKENSETDSAWEDAKRELYGQPDAWSQVGRALRFGMSGGQHKSYDEKKVNALKDALLEALKNATNIRNLKPHENITVCVFGGAAALPVYSASFSPDGRQVVTTGADRTVRIWDVQTGKPMEHDTEVPAHGTIMTIRVLKSDVDAFAKDKLNPDEFRKKAAITTYAGDAGGWGGAVFPGTP